MPAAVGLRLRPERSVSSTPSSRSRALIAADTEGWVTTSSRAAAVTEPRRSTVTKAFSCVSVIAILPSYVST